MPLSTQPIRLPQFGVTGPTIRHLAPIAGWEPGNLINDARFLRLRVKKKKVVDEILDATAEIEYAKSHPGKWTGRPGRSNSNMSVPRLIQIPLNDNQRPQILVPFSSTLNCGVAKTLLPDRAPIRSPHRRSTCPLPSLIYSADGGRARKHKAATEEV